MLDAAGWQTATLDVVGSLGAGGPARAAEAVFRRLLAAPALYDAFHFDQLRPGGALARAAERAGVARATPEVARALEAALGRPPVGLVLSVFATGAGVAARLRREGRCSWSVVLLPDSTAHRMWVHPETDLFLVTSRLGAASVRRYRPDAAVEIIDPPLRAEFTCPPSRAAARAALGLPGDVEVVLVMGGAWGLGPLVELAVALAGSGRYALVACGRNQVVRAQLARIAADRPRLVALGDDTRVSEAMAAADLVVTTPGMTCHEARALGRGLLLLDVVPGHGRENLAHELERGAAAVSGPDVLSVLDAVGAALADPEVRDPPPLDAAAAGRRLLEVLEPLTGTGAGGRCFDRPDWRP